MMEGPAIQANKPKRQRRRGPTKRQVQQMARLCYQDRLRDEEIAALVGISRRTLARWKNRSDVRAVIADLIVAYRAQLTAEAMARQDAWFAELAALPPRRRRRV